MTGEIPLIEHIDRRFADLDRLLDERADSQKVAVDAALLAQEKAVTAALAASEKAVAKAEVSQLRVNEGQNEFRAALKDQASTLMPRTETENLVRELRDKIDDIKNSRSASAIPVASVVVAVSAVVWGVFR